MLKKKINWKIYELIYNYKSMINIVNLKEYIISCLLWKTSKKNRWLIIENISDISSYDISNFANKDTYNSIVKKWFDMDFDTKNIALENIGKIIQDKSNIKIFSEQEVINILYVIISYLVNYEKDKIVITYTLTKIIELWILDDIYSLNIILDNIVSKNIFDITLMSITEFDKILWDNQFDYISEMWVDIMRDYFILKLIDWIDKKFKWTSINKEDLFFTHLKLLALNKNIKWHIFDLNRTDIKPFILKWWEMVMKEVFKVYMKNIEDFSKTKLGKSIYYLIDNMVNGNYIKNHNSRYIPTIVSLITWNQAYLNYMLYNNFWEAGDIYELLKLIKNHREYLDFRKKKLNFVNIFSDIFAKDLILIKKIYLWEELWLIYEDIYSVNWKINNIWLDLLKVYLWDNVVNIENINGINNFMNEKIDMFELIDKEKKDDNIHISFEKKFENTGSLYWLSDIFQDNETSKWLIKINTNANISKLKNIIINIKLLSILKTEDKPLEFMKKLVWTEKLNKAIKIKDIELFNINNEWKAQSSINLYYYLKWAELYINRESEFINQTIKLLEEKNKKWLAYDKVNAVILHLIFKDIKNIDFFINNWVLDYENIDNLLNLWILYFNKEKMGKNEKNNEKTPKKNLKQVLDESIFDFTLEMDNFKTEKPKKVEVNKVDINKEENTLWVSNENYEKILKVSEKLFWNKEMVLPALEYIIHNFNS